MAADRVAGVAFVAAWREGERVERKREIIERERESLNERRERGLGLLAHGLGEGGGRVGCWAPHAREERGGRSGERRERGLRGFGVCEGVYL